MIKVASLLLFFPREVTGMLTHMARAFIGILFVAMWLVFLLYTQGGPISVVTGASRDIFIPLVQSDGAGRVASPNPPQSSAAQPSEGFAPTHAPPEPPPPGASAFVRVRASNESLYGLQAAPEPSEGLASSPPQTAVPAPAVPRPSKSRLAYARFPKTGSRYAISHLFKVMPAHRLNVIPEAKAVRAVGIAKDEFLLASVRNPCESYLSLWAFQSEVNRRAGVMADLRRRDPEAYKRLVGRNSQNGFTGPDDVERFRAWIKFMGHQGSVKLGLLSGRFHGKYLSQDPDMDIRDNAFLVRGMTQEAAAQTVQGIRSASISELADCWMHTESLDADIAGCLKDFESVGGQVDWSKVQSLIQSGTSSGGHGGSKHGGCETFFDEATARLVVELDGALFEKFGYDSCCGHSANLLTLSSIRKMLDDLMMKCLEKENLPGAVTVKAANRMMFQCILSGLPRSCSYLAKRLPFEPTKPFTEEDADVIYSKDLVREQRSSQKSKLSVFRLTGFDRHQWTHAKGRNAVQLAELSATHLGWTQTSDWAHYEACDFEVVDALNEADLKSKFLDMGRPVLVRNFAALEDRCSLAKHRVMKVHRSTRFKLGPIAYPQLIGALPCEKTFTVEEAEKGARCFRHGNTSNYYAAHAPGIFQKELTEMETVAKIHKLIPGINRMSKQYFWGGDRSGAALHYHVAAFNVLFIGEKEWYVTPPYLAARAGIATYELFDRSGVSMDHVFRCSQYAGDLVLLPDGWGHATLNHGFGAGIGVLYDLRK
eukprot:s534_g32.t1